MKPYVIVRPFYICIYVGYVCLLAIADHTVGGTGVGVVDMGMYLTCGVI